MNYRYALIVGLLVSAHILMGSEKDPIYILNTIPDDPSYEKCKEIKDILEEKVIKNTQKKWKISVIPYDSSYYKENSSKICLNYDEVLGSSRKVIVCGANVTDRIRNLYLNCNNKAVHLQSKIDGLEASLRPQLMDYASRSGEICGGI